MPTKHTWQESGCWLSYGCCLLLFLVVFCLLMFFHLCASASTNLRLQFFRTEAMYVLWVLAEPWKYLWESWSWALSVLLYTGFTSIVTINNIFFFVFFSSVQFRNHCQRSRNDTRHTLSNKWLIWLIHVYWHDQCSSEFKIWSARTYKM